MSLKEQLKRQLRALIDGGDLRAGQLLPSAKDLASLLGINRNTVAAAYQELVAERRLKSVVGSGTYVEEAISEKSTDRLQKIFDKSLLKALKTGARLSQVQDFLVSWSAALGCATQGGRVAVLECNREALEEIAATLRRRFLVETESILMADLERAPGEMRNRLKSVDLIVCGFNHVQEVLAAIPEPPAEVVGVLLRPNVQIMNELLRLPPGSNVGFVCVTERAAKSFFKEYSIASGSRLTTVLAGADDHPVLQRLVRKCTTVFATSFAHDRVAAVCPRHLRLVRVDISLDESSLEVIQERLFDSMITKRVVTPGRKR